MKQCRACHSTDLCSIIDLGELPLANALTKAPAPETARIPLEVLFCKSCGLGQLAELVSPEELFSNYVYFSSNSKTMLSSVERLTKNLIPELTEHSKVIEIASNDGYLLKNYVEAGIPVLGIEPAQNIADAANQDGIRTICEFFSVTMAGSLVNKGELADIVHANNVMAHVPDINGFVAGIKLILKQNGKAIIEVPHLLQLLKKLEFDTIYHEHVFYFSLKSLVRLFASHDLDIFDVEELQIHGGSLRLFIGHAGTRHIKESISKVLEEESNSQFITPDYFSVFSDKVLSLRNELRKLLSELRENGKRIAAYGASAKGTTLLHFFGLTHLIDYIVDISATKQGLYAPGTDLEIKHPDSLINESADYALLLSWNFAEEIIQQQENFLKTGGQFIIPLPEVKII